MGVYLLQDPKIRGKDRKAAAPALGENARVLLRIALFLYGFPCSLGERSLHIRVLWMWTHRNTQEACLMASLG